MTLLRRPEFDDCGASVWIRVRSSPLSPSIALLCIDNTMLEN